MALILIIPNRVFAETFIELDIKNYSVSIAESYDYTGNPIVPDIEVFYTNNILELNKDYSYSCYNNIEIGTATILIIGIGDYYGSKIIHFNIVDSNHKKLEQVFDKGLESPLHISVENLSNYAFMNIKLIKGDGKLTYESSNKKIFTIDRDTGAMIAKKPGIAYLTIIASETQNYKEKSKKIKVIVHPTQPECNTSKDVKFKRNANGTGNVTIKLGKVKNATGYIFKLTNDEGTVKTIKTAQTTAAFKNLKKGRYLVFLYSYIETDEVYIRSSFGGFGDICSVVDFSF